MKKQVKRRVASKPRAIQTSRLWRLSHHKHSGHVLPRRSTSYPALLMVVLCMGVFMIGWTRVVTADNSYAVSARVQGQAPTVAATIDDPLSSSTVSSKPVIVTGTCPSSTYVELFRNNFPSGISLCGQDGKYSISTDLFIGLNNLVARDYSFSDTAGPDSSTIAVTYTPVTASAPASEATTSAEESSPNEEAAPNGQSPQAVATEQKSPLRLSSDFTYLGHYTGEKLSWPINIAGGAAPYAVSVDWGDGQHNLYSQKQDGQLTIDHRYKKAGGYKGSYTINISIIDSLGSGSNLQLIAIVNSSTSGFAGGIAGLSSTATSSSDKLAGIIKYAWPSYGVVVLMLLSFWLGERREFGVLKPTSRKPRSR